MTVRTSRISRTSRTSRIVREAALTVGAVLGVLCVLTAVAAPLFGVRLLVFKSGSMSPTVETGGAALARTVDAAELESGDIVSVTSSDGIQVTHRIVDLSRTGDQAMLTLQGDANADADRETYPVTSADRVFWHANGLGYVVDALATPYAVFLAGGAAVGLVTLTFRRRNRTHEGNGDLDRGREDDLDDHVWEREPADRTRRPFPRTAMVGTGLALAALAGLTVIGGRGGSVTPTLASFTDTSEVTGSFGTMTVPQPGVSSAEKEVECQNGPPFSGRVDISWRPPAEVTTNYQYLVAVYPDGASSPNKTYRATTPSASIVFDDINTGSGYYNVRVYGVIDGPGWQSIDSLSRQIWVGATSWNFDCGGTRRQAPSDAPTPADRPSDPPPTAPATPDQKDDRTSESTEPEPDPTPGGQPGPQTDPGASD